MPSPLAHFAAACAIGRTRLGTRLLPASGKWAGAGRLWFPAAVFSLLPDLDAVPGIVAGNIGKFHNYFTHSLGFAVISAAVVAVVAALFFDRRLAAGWFLLCLACCAAHVIMDSFTVGRGVMLFWPLSAGRWESPVKIFYGLHWSENLTSVNHLLTLANEAVFVCVVLVIMRWASRRASGSRNNGSVTRAGGADDTEVVPPL